jgi:hypothetical protein
VEVGDPEEACCPAERRVLLNVNALVPSEALPSVSTGTEMATIAGAEQNRMEVGCWMKCLMSAQFNPAMGIVKAKA